MLHAQSAGPQISDEQFGLGGFSGFIRPLEDYEAAGRASHALILAKPVKESARE
jgi:hypothetical protein